MMGKRSAMRITRFWRASERAAILIANWNGFSIWLCAKHRHILECHLIGVRNTFGARAVSGLAVSRASYARRCSLSFALLADARRWTVKLNGSEGRYICAIATFAATQFAGKLYGALIYYDEIYGEIWGVRDGIWWAVRATGHQLERWPIKPGIKMDW